MADPDPLLGDKTDQMSSTLPSARAEPRYLCPLATTALARTQDGRALSLWMQNLSEHGLGFLYDEQLAVGMVLTLELKCEQRPAPFRLVAQIVHITAMPVGDWYYGCRLATPLNCDDLDALL